MTKYIRITDHKSHQFKLLAERFIRAARLEYLGAPQSMLNKQYSLISECAGLIKSPEDAEKLLNELEEILLHNVSLSFSSTSCLNCVAFIDCHRIADGSQEGIDSTPSKLYPYEDDALKLCDGYHPDWDKFDETAKIYPEIVLSLQVAFGIVVDQKRVALRILDVMGKWAKTVGRRV